MRVFPVVAVVAALAACSSLTDASLVGQWGSQQASVELKLSGGSVTYQCGSGTIDSAWTVGSDGTWNATGQHFFGGGPLPLGGRPPHPARYSGRVSGNNLDFTVVLTDMPDTLGPYHLVRNGPPISEMCL